MSFDFETAAMLGDSAQRYANDKYSLLDRHHVLNDPAGYSAKAWQDYADFGWLALRLPEAAGGLDADVCAIAALMEVVGSRLLMEPVLASAIVGTGLILRHATQAQCATLLPRLADGTLKLAFTETGFETGAKQVRFSADRLSGTVHGILHGDIADLLIVAATDDDSPGARQLYLVDPADAGVTLTRYRFVDGRGGANIRFDQTRAARLDAHPDGNAEEAIAEVLDLATVAQCAEALGIVRMLLNATRDYLKIRIQFGKTIGSNQALQHRAVDMFFLQQEIAALTVSAKQAMTLPVAERGPRVSAAKAYIASAARKVANEAVQMHGGLGVTDELDVSHYFRRLMANAALFGSRDAHFTRFLAPTSEC